MKPRRFRRLPMLVDTAGSYSAVPNPEGACLRGGEAKGKGRRPRPRPAPGFSDRKPAGDELYEAGNHDRRAATSLPARHGLIRRRPWAVMERVDKRNRVVFPAAASFICSRCTSAVSMLIQTRNCSGALASFKGPQPRPRPHGAGCGSLRAPAPCACVHGWRRRAWQRRTNTRRRE